MAHVSKVSSLEAYRFSTPVGDQALLVAGGQVHTSHWSAIRLEPRYYVTPPADGIWESDFVGDPPTGAVLQVIIPVSATNILGVPDWLKGFRVHAANGSVTTKEIKNSHLTDAAALESSLLNAIQFRQSEAVQFRQSHVIVSQTIASYEDSWQPIGLCGGLSIRMKKLRHELTLTVEGPDESKIRSCIQDAIGAGLIAAIIAVYATGGAALPAAISACLGHLRGCLGSEFNVRLDDKSHWIEWCT